MTTPTTHASIDLSQLTRYEPTESSGRHYADFPEGPMRQAVKGGYFRVADVEAALTQAATPTTQRDADERALRLVHELSRISMSLAADLVQGTDYTFEGHDYLDRNFVCERVIRWRAEWDALASERAALADRARAALAQSEAPAPEAPSEPITYTVDGIVLSPVEYINHLHGRLIDQRAAPEAPTEQDDAELRTYRQALEIIGVRDCADPAVVAADALAATGFWTSPVAAPEAPIIEVAIDIKDASGPAVLVIPAKSVMRHADGSYTVFIDAPAPATPAAPEAPAEKKPDHGSLADNLRVEQTDLGRWVVCVENWFPDEDSARAACRKWKSAYSSVPPVKAMVDRFLGWKLPRDFHPDAGISFDRAYADKWGMPSGTNLFHAGQVEAMFEYLINTPVAAPEAPMLHGMRVIVDPAMSPDTARMESGEHSVTLTNIPAATTASAPVPHHFACSQRGYEPFCKGCEAEREAFAESARDQANAAHAVWRDKKDGRAPAQQTGRMQPSREAAPLDDATVEMWMNGIGGGVWRNGKLTLTATELKAAIRGIASLAIKRADLARAPLPAQNDDKEELLGLLWKISDTVLKVLPRHPDPGAMRSRYTKCPTEVLVNVELLARYFVDARKSAAQQVQAVDVARDAAQKVLETILYESDGRWYIGKHGDSDVTELVRLVMSRTNTTGGSDA